MAAHLTVYTLLYVFGHIDLKFCSSRSMLWRNCVCSLVWVIKFL